MYVSMCMMEARITCVVVPFHLTVCHACGSSHCLWLCSLVQGLTLTKQLHL